MAQMGFFDVENRYAALDAKHDPLVKSMPSFPGKPSVAPHADYAEDARG